MTASEELVRRAKNSVFGSSPRPKKRLAVVTCMDGRIDPLRILAMSLGDIHVIRNAGGIVTEDVLRSLLVSQRMLGTREVLIFMHTDCGLYGLDERAEKAAVEAETASASRLNSVHSATSRPGSGLSAGGPVVSVPPPSRSDQRRHFRRRWGRPSSPSLKPAVLPSRFDL